MKNVRLRFFIPAKQRAKQSCLRRYLSAAARVAEQVPVALVQQRPKRSVDQIPRSLLR